MSLMVPLMPISSTYEATYRKVRSDSNIDAGRADGVLVAVDSRCHGETVNIPELIPLEAILVKFVEFDNLNLWIAYSIRFQWVSVGVLGPPRSNNQSSCISSTRRHFLVASDLTMPSIQWVWPFTIDRWFSVKTQRPIWMKRISSPSHLIQSTKTPIRRRNGRRTTVIHQFQEPRCYHDARNSATSSSTNATE